MGQVERSLAPTAVLRRQCACGVAVHHG